MNVVNWQGGQSSFFRWYLIGEYSFQQWGYGPAGTITYPIQFTEIAYTAFACDIAESNENIVSVATNPPEINQIVVRPSAAKTITWLVIGKQQWGIKPVESAEYPYIWAFPVSFASKNIGVFVTNNDSTINNGAIGVYDVLTESAKIALYGKDNDNTAFLFAIGQQLTNKCPKKYNSLCRVLLH